VATAETCSRSTSRVDQTANLLVFIQGERDRFQDVDLTPELGEFVLQKFGSDVRRRMEAKGLLFTAGLDTPLPT
jgi:hypothetical protein